VTYSQLLRAYGLDDQGTRLEKQARLAKHIGVKLGDRSMLVQFPQAPAQVAPPANEND
jgi:hypothetical protein